ncbi:unnamed protein product [Rhizophagus irregularis]|nr:unnamed protein product [Rhizophagus irregularis]
MWFNGSDYFSKNPTLNYPMIRMTLLLIPKRGFQMIRPMHRRRKRIPWSKHINPPISLTYDSNSSGDAKEIDPGRSSKVEVSTSFILQGRSISRLPISILPDETDEKRKHIVGLVLEQFPYLSLRYSENYGDKFVFNSSVPC